MPKRPASCQMFDITEDQAWFEPACPGWHPRNGATPKKDAWEDRLCVSCKYWKKPNEQS